MIDHQKDNYLYVNIINAGSEKLRSTGTSPVKARSSPKVSPLSPFGRSIKARKDNRLPLSPMSPLSPGIRRQQTGHASDSELT